MGTIHYDQPYPKYGTVAINEENWGFLGIIFSDKTK